MVPLVDDWPREKIKEAIYAKGISLDALAVQKGYSNSVVRQAMTRPLPAGERVISEFLGVPAHEIWPSRYYPDGRSRSRPKIPSQVTAEARTAHRQKRGVA